MNDTVYRWHTSSFSNASGGNCVEVAEGPRAVNIRDTQHRHLGHLAVPATEWRAFLHAVRKDELD
ncbi:DUF397 domain-containing protein [Spiractinospora alimapuensis]|uniref:DUF397 domain-containing protein n=1 Tax=Spiractinospora alimapuensis TaxID=2820884 RepID=UPI001F253948|nr:DUF397 domain-containing protein [Spiractinospora alimapuensis]QVQ52198.1 DUF397 domain-containing protein [Spiractinospora alimapuensis]